MTVAQKLTAVAENTPRLFEAGKQAEYDRFWDTYQRSGNYCGAFAGGVWNREILKPKYDIKPQSALFMFYYSTLGGDLVEYFEKLGIALDFSINNNANNTFQYSNFTRVGKIYSSSADTWYSTFYGCTKLVTIDEFGSYTGGEIRNGLSSAFTDCTALENVRVRGVIAGSVSFKWSPKLSKESVQSIIDHLKDLTGKTPLTLTFHPDISLTDEQKAAIKGRNWIIGN